MKPARLFFVLAAVSLWCAPPLDANPDGVWSDGTLSTATGGVFSPSTVPVTDKDYTGELAWTDGGFCPAVRWTAPADGVYNVSGLFQRNGNQTDASPVAVAVSVVQNGTAVRFRQANFVTFQSQAAFDLPALPLLAGTTLDFVESPDVPHHDTVGLIAKITDAGALTGPIVNVSATVPVTIAGSGTPGIFTLTRSGDPSQKLVVHYTVRGSAKGGFNYAVLSGKAKFKLGQSTATVAVYPINQVDALTKTLVKIVLTHASDFYVGTPDRAKVKIVDTH